MKDLFTIIMIIFMLPAIHSQNASPGQSNVDMEKQIKELQQQNKQLLSELRLLQEKSNTQQQSLEERVFRGEETISLLQEQMKLQQQLTKSIEQRLDQSNADVTTRMSTLSNHQKTMQTIQYPGLIAALLLGFIVYLVLGRRFQKKQVAFSQDLIQFSDLISGSLETIKNDHQRAMEKIKNDINEFTEKAKHDHTELSNNFSVQLNKYAKDSEQTFAEKIRPLELKLSRHDQSFNDYASRIEELKNTLGEHLQNREEKPDLL